VAPVRDADTPEALRPGHAAIEKPMQPSAYWGDEKLWNSKVNNHNSMFDNKGRLWMAAAIRGPDNPQFCKQGSSHPSAKLFPIEKNVRQLAMLEPKTMAYKFVDTCFGSHHLQFGYDANDTIWTSGSGQVAGWLNSKKFDETCDAAASQGWTAFVLDTNGNGKRDPYTEPGQPMDPAKDMRPYAVMPSPVDGSIWYTIGVFAGRGAVRRLDPGPNPPETALSEIYFVPAPGFGPRGGDIDKQGVAAATSAASTGASARVLSTDPLQRATIARRDGRSTSIRAPASTVSAITVPRRAITPGSTSTIHLVWARTYPCRRATSMMASSPSRTGKCLCCACPIRWVFTPRDLTGASMMPMPDGRAAGCGPRAAIEPRG